MSLPIIWSPASKNEYAEILKYVEQHFGLDATLKLLEKTDNAMDNIAKFPSMYKASKKELM